MGKLLLRWARIFANEFDLSGDARTFSNLDNAMDGVDMHGWSDTSYWYLPDQLRQAGIRGFQALLNDAASGAFTALKDQDITVVSLLFGDAAEPAAGDVAYLLGGTQFSVQPGFDGGAATISGDWLPDEIIAQPMGVVLHPKTSLAATTQGNEIDNGAATTNGWQANLHITASSGGEWAFTIEHSTTGAWAGEEATLGTFTADGSAVAGERLTGTGTVNEFVRFVATRTSGSVTPVCTFARN
jgi:hypothetical protein